MIKCLNQAANANSGTLWILIAVWWNREFLLVYRSFFVSSCVIGGEVIWWHVPTSRDGAVHCAVIKVVLETLFVPFLNLFTVIVDDSYKFGTCKPITSHNTTSLCSSTTCAAVLLFREDEVTRTIYDKMRTWCINKFIDRTTISICFTIFTVQSSFSIYGVIIIYPLRVLSDEKIFHGLVKRHSERGSPYWWL